MEDAALISLLDANFEEDFVVSVISSESIETAHSQNLPTVDATTDLDQKVIELGDQLRASGNAEIFAQVEEMNNGSWSESWIEVAEIGNLLYQDYQLGPNLENLGVQKYSLPNPLLRIRFIIPSILFTTNYSWIGWMLG